MAHHTTVTTDHVEYASADPAATRKFLETVFGFKFNVMPEMGGYGLRDGELARGAGTGVREIMKSEPAGTIAYLTVHDLDAAIKTAEHAGAKVVQPKTEIPGTGWSSIVHAPGGVMVGLYQLMPK